MSRVRRVSEGAERKGGFPRHMFRCRREKLLMDLIMDDTISAESRGVGVLVDITTPGCDT